MRWALPSDVFSHRPVQRSPQLAGGSRLLVWKPGPAWRSSQISVRSPGSPKHVQHHLLGPRWPGPSLAAVPGSGADLLSQHLGPLVTRPWPWACPLCIAPLPRMTQSSSWLLTDHSGSIDQLVTWWHLLGALVEGLLQPPGGNVREGDPHPTVGRGSPGPGQSEGWCGPGCGEVSRGQAWSPARPFSSPPLKGASGSSLSF